MKLSTKLLKEMIEAEMLDMKMPDIDYSDSMGDAVSPEEARSIFLVHSDGMEMPVSKPQAMQLLKSGDYVSEGGNEMDVRSGILRIMHKSEKF
tara:strand:+ start:5705 stop:5983 length:279 start_codon:yes stop_codon:yes gene_type:complete